MPNFVVYPELVASTNSMTRLVEHSEAHSMKCKFSLKRFILSNILLIGLTLAWVEADKNKAHL